jgi:glyoxalase/bleomycin resistance protein/dioxygenase superfamily protein
MTVQSRSRCPSAASVLLCSESSGSAPPSMSEKRALKRLSGRYGGPMALDLFAGVRVSDYETAKPWYERLLGAEPSFIAHATEAVWELAEHRFLFIVEDAEGAGRAIHTVFVDDLDTLVADIASRGIEPDELVTYPGKARKAIYRDTDGNEIGFGGAID